MPGGLGACRWVEGERIGNKRRACEGGGQPVYWRFGGPQRLLLISPGRAVWQSQWPSLQRCGLVGCTLNRIWSQSAPAPAHPPSELLPVVRPQPKNLQNQPSRSISVISTLEPSSLPHPSTWTPLARSPLSSSTSSLQHQHPSSTLLKSKSAGEIRDPELGSQHSQCCLLTLDGTFAPSSATLSAAQNQLTCQSIAIFLLRSHLLRVPLKVLATRRHLYQPCYLDNMTKEIFFFRFSKVCIYTSVHLLSTNTRSKS